MDWERDHLISNLAGGISAATPDIQEKMISLLSQCNEDDGRRVAAALKDIHAM